MLIIHDLNEIKRHLLDLPLTASPSDDPVLAFKTPGNCVKSKTFDESGHPDRFGKLVSYSKENDRVVVIDPPGRSPWMEPFVWIGTIFEYESCWRID